LGGSAAGDVWSNELGRLIAVNRVAALERDLARGIVSERAALLKSASLC
jgi:hypothetical protein